MARNILSPKAVTVAIVLWYCHLGPNGSEDAITFLTWTNYPKNSLFKAAAWARTGTSLSASAHGEVEMLVRGWLAWEMGGLGIYTFRVKELHAHSRDWLPRMLWCWLAPCRRALLGFVSQWDPIGSLSPLTAAAGLLTSGHSFPRALFSPWEPQVLFTLGVCRGGRTKENRCSYPVERFNLGNCAQTGKK